MGLVCLLGVAGCVFNKEGSPHYDNDAAVLPDGSQPFCGNGEIDQGEDCDGLELGGATCASREYTAGELTCSPTCLFNESECTTCGNNVLEGTEHCDGAQLANQTCQLLSFDGGELSCGTDCQFDTSLCTGSGCGDGTIDPGEDCEGGNLGGLTCATLGQGFTGGTLICGSNCLYETSGCFTCGDDTQSGAEQCDGADLNGFTCVSLGHDGGSLACLANCTYDVTNCSDCGNDIRELGEQCDGPDLDGTTCTSMGYTAGTLVCGPTCGFDDSGCTECGNAVLETGEECDDGSTLNSDSTPDACRTNCLLPFCGDGVCDTADLGTGCPGDCRVVLFFDDFDGAWPNGWVTWDDYPEWNQDYTDTWEPATNSSHSGANSLWCAGNGNNSSDYDNNMGAWAVQTLNLSGLSGMTIHLDMWIAVHVADGTDYFALRVSVDGGTNWTDLQVIGGDTGWVLYNYDISAAAGLSDVRIALYFYSNGAVSWEYGAYVDDVEVWYQM